MARRTLRAVSPHHPVTLSPRQGRGEGEEGQEEGQFRWSAALTLGLVGLALNLLPIELSPGTELVLGGVPYLLAAAALGPLPGAAAAAIASVRTIPLWHHPYAWLISCLEAAVVGLLMRRWGRRALVADLAYWVVLGVPLLCLTYGVLLRVHGTTLVVLALKQALNGLVDAVAVELLLLLPPVRWVLRVRGATRLQSALAAVVVTAAVLPALVFGVWVGRREWSRSLVGSRERLALFSEAYASKLEQYIALHERSVASIARAAERRGTFDPEQLRRLVAGEHAAFPGFTDVYVADSRGVSVAFDPAVDRNGQPLVGVDFSRRPYYEKLRATLAPVISDVSAGRSARDRPLVVIGHPIILADTFAGYALGALDLAALPGPQPVPSSVERLRVVDRRGVIVYDSGRRYRAGEAPRPFSDSVALRAVLSVEGSGVVTIRSPEAVAPADATASQVVAGVAELPSLGWRVWVEEPFLQIQGFVSQSYVRLFSLLIAVVLLALLVSTYLARYLSRPLLQLQAAAGALAAGDLRARVGPMSAAAPSEVHELGRGFDEMAEALSVRSEELEELAEIARSLASTLQLGEVLHRVIDASVRLVDPDGCGIVLLAPDGETLEAARYSLGLLAPSAGRQISADSLAGWVARRGQSVLVPDAAADTRIDPSYIDAGQVRSVVCAPLVGRSGALGALVAVRSRSNPRSFHPADLHLLERLAGYAAVAVENARLLEAAEAASRAKSDFIATMSHELRTPLNAVLGHLELLEIGVHGEMNDAQRQALARIRSATRHLRGLIEEVLSFSRLEAGHTDLTVVETDLCDLLEEVAEVVEPLALEKRLEFHTHCEDGAPLVLRSDPDKIRQILINLAGNAVKFTERGRISIRAERRDGELSITVEDTGAGISPDDQARLFRPFEQLETGLSRRHGGTGLGLYLSRRYADLLGGRIEVDSRPGEGSRFSLVLPEE
jgi:signal transduction histidine kinase